LGDGDGDGRARALDLMSDQFHAWQFPSSPAPTPASRSTMEYAGRSRRAINRDRQTSTRPTIEIETPGAAAMCRGIWVPLSVSIETHAIQLQPHTCGVRPATNSNAGPCRHLVGGLPCQRQRQRQRRPACLPPLQRRTGPKKSTRPADLLGLGGCLALRAWDE
jgi:hypothetical protein